MSKKALPTAVYMLLALIPIWFLGKYLTGILLPFLLGAAIALISEPGVGAMARRLPRSLAAGLGITLTLILGAGLLSAAGAVAAGQVRRLISALPDLEDAVREGIQLLQDRLIAFSYRLPEGMQGLMRQGILNLFSDSSALLQKAAGYLPGLLGAMMGSLPGTALTTGTGILSAYLISARLPALRRRLSQLLPEQIRSKWVPAVRRIRQSLKSYFLAQGKLCAITLCVVMTGLFLLKIPFAPLWALAISLVDAVPMLGTGTVLLPWSLIRYLSGDGRTALGMLGLYGLCLLLRNILEPRLLGKHLGLDPLLTLFFLYLGFRFWGLPGMILSPIVAAGIKSGLNTQNTPE